MARKNVATTEKRRMTPADWAAVRMKWESDPRDGYTWIVAEMGLRVSTVAVLKRVRNEGWSKKSVMKSIVERAQVQADEKVNGGVNGQRGFSPELTPCSKAVDLRAGVIERHRAEWDRHRDLFTLDTMMGDTGIIVARVAKTSAEAIKIRQDGERRAWGLDAIAEDTSSGVATLDELDAMFALAVKQSQAMQERVRKERSSLIDADS